MLQRFLSQVSKISNSTFCRHCHIASKVRGTIVRTISISDRVSKLGDSASDTCHHFELRSPIPESSWSPPRESQDSSQHRLPDIESPVSAVGTSRTASKRRLRDLGRGSPIIVEDSPPSPKAKPARTSSEVSPTVVAMIRNCLENHQDRE